MEKIIVILEVDAWHGHSTESLWASPLNKDLYKIENSPFFERGLSFEDVVEVEERTEGKF
ncbi:MAG: DUF4265 domain-containing protein, partial [Dinoroseobacter sp.]|nr:DUF4265 domain-containing protein [Dinoroseobacter sp.]